MEVTKIPFIEKMGIKQDQEGNLVLDFDESVQNHVQTIHASAQFALAETASGEILQTLFPELVGKVIPILRDAQIKFKKPAQKSITTQASVDDLSISKFRDQFERKGRSSISVNVEVIDQDDVITTVGVFKWFVQNIASLKI